MRPQEVVERALELLGPDRGSVLVDDESSAHLRWANSTLTTNGISAQRRVHVVVHPEVVGGTAAGSASADVRTSDDLASLVDQARMVARAAGPARDAAAEVPPRPASNAWDEPSHETSPDELAVVGRLLGEVLPAADIDHFGFAEHTVHTTYLATSSGLRLRHDQPAARYELCGKSAGRTRSAWAGRAGRSFADLDLAGTAQEVRQGLQLQATPVPVAPGRQRVVLAPSAVADLLVYLYWSASALDAAEGRSALSRPGGRTRVGERLSEHPVWMSSDPTVDGLQCAAHVLDTESSAMSSAFDTGLPVTATDWMSDGILRALVTTRHSAALAGLAHTPAVDNLMAGVAGHDGTVSELARRVGDGLLITCLWYIREVDAQSLLLTGLTRDGVYVIRDGEVVGASGNFRFNDSPIGMLGRIVDAGTPVDCLPREWGDWFTRARVAPLAVDDFNLSTASEAI